MLRELGPQRPSVFEILNNVHALRGSTSRFNYAIPVPPPLSPSKQRASMFSPSSVTSPSANPLDGLVSYGRNSQTTVLDAAHASQSPPAGSGIQARDRVLEAIAPMRRGRPAGAGAVTAFGTGVADRASSPVKKSTGLGTDDNSAWKHVKGHKSGVVSSGAWKLRRQTGDMDDAWKPKGPVSDVKSPIYTESKGGFGDAFSDTLVGSMSSSTDPSTTAKTGSSPMPIPPRPTTQPDSLSAPRGARLGTSAPKDAFHGLGFAEKNPAPTLGEASKARSGLAATGGLSSSETARLMSSNPSPSLRPSLAPQPTPSTSSARTSPAGFAPQPSPSPQPLQPPSLPSRPTSSLRPPAEDLTPEQRFPSLEELDRTFASPSPSLPSSMSAQNAGVRSQPVTGGAMLRDARADSSDRRFGGTPTMGRPTNPDPAPPMPARPGLTRKHRSSVTVNTSSSQPAEDRARDVKIPTPSRIFARPETKDWLTGDDEGQEVALPSRMTGGPKPPGTPVLRNSPSKRASFIEKSDFSFQSPQEAVASTLR